MSVPVIVIETSGLLWECSARLGDVCLEPKDVTLSQERVAAPGPQFEALRASACLGLEDQPPDEGGCADEEC